MSDQSKLIPHPNGSLRNISLRGAAISGAMQRYREFLEIMSYYAVRSEVVGNRPLYFFSGKIFAAYLGFSPTGMHWTLHEPDKRLYKNFRINVLCLF